MKITRTVTKTVLIGMICATILVFGCIAAEEFIVSSPRTNIESDNVTQVQQISTTQPEETTYTSPKGVIILT